MKANNDSADWEKFMFFAKANEAAIWKQMGQGRSVHSGSPCSFGMPGFDHAQCPDCFDKWFDRLFEAFQRYEVGLGRPRARGGSEVCDV